jgi:hypothetical protein
VAAFSFCQDKIISTGGEGGMLTTSDEIVGRRAWSYKDHGKSYDAVYHRPHPPGFRWLHESVGTNWRLTEAQSAMGRALLRKLPQRVEQRRRLASLLTDRFSRLRGLRVTRPAAEIFHSYYKYYVLVKLAELAPGWDRDRIMAAVVAEGIPCFSGSCSEIYLEKAFPEAMRPATRLKVAKELGETSLMFLVHSTLSESDMQDTCGAMEKVMEVATRG